MLENKKLAVAAMCGIFMVGCASSLAQQPLNAETILQRIGKQGSKEVASDFTHEQWDAVLNNIEVGDEAWLELAVKLHMGADAGYAEMLTFSVGRALAKSPHNVLSIAVPEFSIEGICGYPDMTDPRTDTKMKVISYLDERIEAMSHLGNQDVAKTNARCLQVLEETRREVISGDGPFGGN